MNSTRKLMKDARTAAAFRGHKLSLTRQVKVGNARFVYDVDCTRCGASLRVNPNPAPNEVDVGGSAVAVGCPGVTVTRAVRVGGTGVLGYVVETKDGLDFEDVNGGWSVAQ
jgi:hypothetical protein